MRIKSQHIKRNRWLFFTITFLIAALCGSFCANGQDTAAGKTVSQNKFQRLIKKKNTVLLDVRTIEEYKAGHIPNSAQIDVLKKDEFKTNLNGLDKNKTYLVYCRSGKRSKEAMRIMKELGFNRLYDLEGGFSKWTGEKE